MDISFKFKPRLKPRVTFVKGLLALYGSLAYPIEQAAYAAGGEGCMECKFFFNGYLFLNQTEG